ncbi:MAG: hypothetical protein BJ554DRAFT_5149, partial [Olpidium bornovanus]
VTNTARVTSADAATCGVGLRRPPGPTTSGTTSAKASRCGRARRCARAAIAASAVWALVATRSVSGDETSIRLQSKRREDKNSLDVSRSNLACVCALAVSRMMAFRRTFDGEKSNQRNRLLALSKRRYAFSINPMRPARSQHLGVHTRPSTCGPYPLNHPNTSLTFPKPSSRRRLVLVHFAMGVLTGVRVGNNG